MTTHLPNLSNPPAPCLALPLSGFRLSCWKVPLSTLALGIYGLFGYHFLLFLALRHAPPVQANLVNYLWPLLIVVLAPVILPGMRLRLVHVVAALLGFAGAAVVILGGTHASAAAGGSGVAWAWGYLFALVSGLLALLCHALMEPAVVLSPRDWTLIVMP